MIPDGFWLCRECLQVHEKRLPECARCRADKEPMYLHNPTGLLIGDFRRLIRDVERSAIHELWSIPQWVEALSRYTDTLSNGDASDEVADLFWVKLHGAMVELPSHFEETAKMVEAHRDHPVFGPDTPNPDAVSTIGKALAVRFHAFQLAKWLDRDECIYAEWCRHRVCHLTQRKYYLQVRKSGLKELAQVKSLDSLIPLQEQWEAIERVGGPDGGDPRQVAARIARRIRGAVKQLRRAYFGYLDVPG